MKKNILNELTKSVKDNIKEALKFQQVEDETLEEKELRNVEIEEKIKIELEDKINDAMESAKKEGDADKIQILKSLSFQDKGEIRLNVFRGIREYGLISKFRADSNVTEIMINDYNNIYIEENGELKPIEESFDSPEELLAIINKFTHESQTSVNKANPIVDTTMDDGSRVNVVVDPVALGSDGGDIGRVVTIRRFKKMWWTIERLIKEESLSREVADVLKVLIDCRYNIIVSGGTGSGKTTFLNAISHFIPETERIITIEDTAELQITSIRNKVRLLTRQSIKNEKMSIDITRLIRSALRMRPDRIIVGEVRGPEALDMLQAMNTGHDGSISTGHANNAENMIRRLETMILQGSVNIPLNAIREQICSAVEIIIHLSRRRDKTRKVVSVSEVVEYDFEHNRVIVEPLFTFVENEHSTYETVKGDWRRNPNHKLKRVQKLIDAGAHMNEHREIVEGLADEEALKKATQFQE